MKDHDWTCLCATLSRALEDTADISKAAAARLDELEREGAVLREALESITARYVDLASSGDCGFWDCEQEDVVKQARAALKGEAT
jgi:hypothetical protein